MMSYRIFQTCNFSAKFCHKSWIRMCSNKIMNDSLLQKLDKNSTPNPSMEPQVRSKLLKTLESKRKKAIDPVEHGMMEAQSSVIQDILEDALQSKSLHGIFQHAPVTSDIITIKEIKINRDLSHVDVVWGSDIFENFATQAHEKYGEKEGQHIENRLFKSVTKTLQQKESKFRTALMRSMDLRRVPRIFFAAPTSKSAAGPGQADEAMATWAKEEEERVKARDAWSEDNISSQKTVGLKMKPFSLVFGGDIEGDQEDEVDEKSRMPVDMWLMKPDGR